MKAFRKVLFLVLTLALVISAVTVIASAAEKLNAKTLYSQDFPSKSYPSDAPELNTSNPYESDCVFLSALPIATMTAQNEGTLTRWHSNVFDADSAFEKVYALGEQITHPTEDANFLSAYGVKDAAGNVTLYTFKGWTADPTADPVEIVTSFPTVDSETGVCNYYPVYESTVTLCANVLAVRTKKVDIVFNSGAEAVTETREIILSVYTTNLSLVSAVSGATEDTYLSLEKDFKSTGDSILATLANQGVTVTFDLNGHSFVHINTSKKGSFAVKSGATLIVTSSKPGAVFENRTFSGGKCTGGTAAFVVAASGTLKVLGCDNLVVRSAVLVQTAGANVNVLVDSAVYHHCYGDSSAMNMIQSTSNATFVMKKVTVVESAGNPKLTDGIKDVFDIGYGAKSVTNVKVTVEDSTVFCAEGNPKCIVNRFPTGAVITLKNTVGNFKAGCKSTEKGLIEGTIVIDEGCSFAEMPVMNANPVITMAEGVVMANTKTLAKVSISLDYEKFTAAYTGTNNATANLSFTNANVSTKAEKAQTVTWYDGEAKETKLFEAIWLTADYTDADTYNFVWQDAVPVKTEENGITFVYPDGAWKLFSTDGGYAIAPDTAKREIKSISGFKQNMLLYSDFRMNLYIPCNAGVTVSAKVNGETVDCTDVRNIAGKDYYVATVAVNADEAAEVIEYVLTLTYNGKSATQSVKTAVALYAKALGATVSYKDLSDAMLRYAKAAFVLQNPTAALPSILNVDDAQEHATHRDAVNTVTSAVVSGAAYALTDKPVFVLALTPGYEGTVSIKIGDTAFVKEVLATDDKVVFSEIPLNNMDRTFEIFVGDTSVGSYNLSAYIASQTDATVIGLADALYDYAVAARTYLQNR